MPATRSLTIPRCPRRDELAGAATEVLIRGVGGKADVLVVAIDGAKVVVKDFAPRRAWARLLGRVQIARETKAYARLAGVPGVPGFVGRIDPWALAVERVDGERLAFAKIPPTDGPRHVARLRAILDGIHERGIVHNDLRGRENVLLRADGDLAVVDFAAAVRFRPGSLAHRLVFRAFAMADEAAFLKWKGMLAPGSYTTADEAYLRRFERWRALWPFNPKRRRAKAGTA